MSQVNNPLDLNLLRVFFAIWDLRSLTAAGDRLGLTQPAISHSLRRLRERFGDPLFVRVANRMLPTDAAVRLHEPLDQAFELLNRTLQSGVVFDPRVTERTFRVAMSDIAEVYILPRLINELSRISPSIRVHIVPLLPESLVSSMRSGEIDLAIGAVSVSDKNLISIDVFNDRYICLVRANHPIAKSETYACKFFKATLLFRANDVFSLSVSRAMARGRRRSAPDRCSRTFYHGARNCSPFRPSCDFPKTLGFGSASRQGFSALGYSI